MNVPITPSRPDAAFELRFTPLALSAAFPSAGA